MKPFRLWSRLVAVSTIAMVFAASGFGVCIEDAVSTYGQSSRVIMGGNSYIINNPDSTLATYGINYSADAAANTCQTQNTRCTSNGTLGFSSFMPSVSISAPSVDQSFSNPSGDKTYSSTQTINNVQQYGNLVINSGANVTMNVKNNISTFKIKTLKITDNNSKLTINKSSNYSVEIEDLGSNTGYGLLSTGTVLTLTKATSLKTRGVKQAEGSTVNLPDVTTLNAGKWLVTKNATLNLNGTDGDFRFKDGINMDSGLDIANSSIVVDSANSFYSQGLQIQNLNIHADTININGNFRINDGGTATINPNSAARVTMKANADVRFGQNSTIYLAPGDYYFQNLIIESNVKVIPTGTGTVRIFAYSSFTDSSTSTGMKMNEGEDPSKLLLYVKNGVKLMGNTKISALIISEGQVELANTGAAVNGAIISGNNTILSTGTSVTYDGRVKNIDSGSTQTVCVSPEINLKGNNVSIANHSYVPNVSNNTDFGTIAGNSSLTKTFTIYNEGSGSLTLGTLLLSGTNSGNFTITQPSSTSIASGSNKTFTVTFTPNGSGIKEANVTIPNNDSDENPYVFTISGVGQPTISISPPTLSTVEGNNSAIPTYALYTVTLSSAPAPSTTVTVDYRTSDGTATAGSDYTLTSGTLTFTPTGPLTQTISVPIIGDTSGEPNETYTLTLSSPTNATIVTATATGTITNDDLPSLSIADVSIAEGNSGTKTMTFTVTLTPAATSNVTVKYATSSGTATSGSDYTAIPSTILPAFTSGQSSKTFTVTIKGDTTVEADETFYVNLTNPTGATISDAQAIGTILDDDTNYQTDNLRAFTSAYSINAKGDIKLIGNSIFLDNGSCATTSNNDVTNPTYAQYDQEAVDNGYLNSTMSTLSLPAGISGSKIKYAALTWQGRLNIKTIDDSGVAIKAKKVRLKLPGVSGGYREIFSNTSKFNWSYNTNNGGNGDDYQGVADITALLQQSITNSANASGYSGDIWVADILADLKPNGLHAGYGAWSLVVVYEDDTTTLKNLTVYDGYKKINNTISESVTLSGFLTPSAGAVNASFFIFGGEGDIDSGDRVSLTNQSSTLKLLSTNGEVFTSSVTDESGYNVTTRTPDCSNTIGIDIHSFSVGTNSSLNIIGNGQTTTTVKMEGKQSYTNPNASFSNYDTHFPGLFAFATDIYQPFISINKTANTGGGTLSAGQEITYTADINNTGNENASDIVIYDNFDDNNLTRVDGVLSDPLVTLGDLLVRDANALRSSISCTYGPSNTNCASSCTVTASPFKISCPIPTLSINQTAKVQFKVKLSTTADTQGQNLKVENKMIATYKNSLTGQTVPDSSSNPAYAGDYDSSGGTVVTPPTYQNQYACGVFDNVLTSYKNIVAGSTPGNTNLVFNTSTISYPTNGLSGSIECNVNGVQTSCGRSEPPKNKLTYTVVQSSKLGTAESTPTGTLSALEYGDFIGNYSLTLAPSTTYGSSTPVMVLGDVSFTGNGNTLTLAPGDYFFNSLKFEGNNPSIVLNNGGPVRIFIKNNFIADKNSLEINKNGVADNLFIYVGGDILSTTNGTIGILKGFMYVKGNVTINANSANVTVHGGISAEGTVTIEGKNGEFYQDGDASSMGYGTCQLCYAAQNGGKLISFGSFMSGTFNFPRTVAIPNTSAQTLSNVLVKQVEDTSGFSGSAGCYDVVDEFGTNLNKNVSVTYTSFFGEQTSPNNCAMSFGDTTVTANIGSYQAGSTSDYNAIKTTGMSGSFMGSSNLKYYASYTSSDGKNYDVQLGYCSIEDTPEVTYYSTGPYDAWDTFRSVTDQNISTKIASQDFNLTIASLNVTKTSLEAKSSGIKARYRLIDIDSGTYKTTEQLFDANASASITSSFNVASATKNMKVEFRYCADYNGTSYLLKDDASCTANCLSNTTITNNNPCFRKVQSSDAFAIRPNAFKVFSQNLYKRSGEDFNITIKAIDEGNGTISGVNKDNVFGVSGYNAALNDLSVVSAPLNEKITNTTGATPLPNTNGCLNAGVFTKNAPNFVDGNTTATLSFSETGILDINVSEIPGHEWAIVDADDTSDNDRYINPSIQSYDESSVGAPVIYAFIPYTIQTTATLDATTAQRWLYVNESYFNDGRPNVKPMGGIMTYTITAKNKNGDVTKNFDKECFSYVDEAHCPKINGLKKNTTFDLFLDANITTNADRNRKIIFYTEDNASNAVFVPTKTYNYLQNTPMKIQEWIGSDVFQNGIGYAKVYFNFDRNQTVAINPLNVSIVDINTSTSWMANAGATNNFVGMTPTDHNLTFVYGRFIPRDVRVFGNVPFSANGWYEVYGAPTIGGTALIPSRNDSGWYINSLHDDTSGGNATVDDISSGALPTSSTYTNGLETYGFDGRTPPYSAKAHVNTEPWLWYGINADAYVDPDGAHLDCFTHPCFNINVVPELGTSGSAKSGAEQQMDNKTMTNTPKSGSTWKSTSDYAPAIR